MIRNILLILIISISGCRYDVGKKYHCDAIKSSVASFSNMLCPSDRKKLKYNLISNKCDKIKLLKYNNALKMGTDSLHYFLIKYHNNCEGYLGEKILPSHKLNSRLSGLADIYLSKSDSIDGSSNYDIVGWARLDLNCSQNTLLVHQHRNKNIVREIYFIKLINIHSAGLKKAKCPAT